MRPLQSWIILALAGCIASLWPAHNSNPRAAEKLNAVSLPAAPYERDADDTGRFIAGLPGKPGSPFAQLEDTDAWRAHRRWLDAGWHKAEDGFITHLGEFQKQELGTTSTRNSAVFYPFGGPDALALTLYFPDSPVYVSAGLEPAGTLPAFRQLATARDLPKYLAEVRDAMASELNRSFFVTREMDRQFRGQVTDGLLLPIMILLARTNHTVLSVRYVRVDENGQVVERPAQFKSPGRFSNKGVEIAFRSDSAQLVHKLYYFSVNLSDQELRQNLAFLSYLARLKNTATLLKATSYMPHRSDFSLIRNHVLTNSSVILQDDSGIPFRFFQPDSWNVQLYGKYDRPYGSFRWLEQPDLRKAYQSSNTRPLSLHIGYGYFRIPSNLLLATRATAAVSPLKGDVAR